MTQMFWQKAQASATQGSFFLLGAREGRPGEDKRGQLCIKYLERRRPLENSFSDACCRIF